MRELRRTKPPKIFVLSDETDEDEDSYCHGLGSPRRMNDLVRGVKGRKEGEQGMEGRGLRWDREWI